MFKSSEVEEKRQLIKLVLSNPRVNGENIDYEAQKPFDMLLNCADRQDWLPTIAPLRTFNWKNVLRMATFFNDRAVLFDL